MDLEGLNLRDKRNRFQVNRVDTSVIGSTSELPSGSSNNGLSPTLVGYKDLQIETSTGEMSPRDEESEIAMGPVSESRSTGNSITTDTKYAKSFRHYTHEALPRLDNYRNMMSIQAAYRPTLDELHDCTSPEVKSSLDVESPLPHIPGIPDGGTTLKFGWIKGVFVRCLLNIWGVMLFLRLSWVVGQAGMIEACIIILLATAVTLLTGISMSAISTNGTIKGGGTYYMISRSLGPEFGASIGAIFSLANAIAVAMYTVGFAESMVDLLKSYGTYVVPDDANSVRIIGTVAIIFQTCVVVVGMEWEASAQIGLLFILLAAMVDFVIGSFIGPTSAEELSKGFVGYNSSLFLENLVSSYRYSEETEQNFFSVFSIFFPAATGILAGANISGNLADPQYAIPKGTLLAILVTTISYLGFALIAGATVVRDATGPGPLNLSDPYDWATAIAGFRDCYISNETTGIIENTCTEWGLVNSFQVMELISGWGLLIYLGCFAATLSSALASLVSAPKVFQALCNDKLFPYIESFGRGYGKNNEPVRGYVLTFFIALAFILVAELNAIAPLISNFFLAAYALVNFSTFHVSLAKPVGWRPTFKYYNMWLSLLGAILCVAVMFLISWVTALLTFGVILFLYMLVSYHKPDVNWGSSTQAQTYKTALSSVQQLNNVNEHVKNYRPQILVLSGMPSVRPSLVDFAYLITKSLSLLVCGHILKAPLNNRQHAFLRERATNWFLSQKIKAFYCVMDDMEFENGSKALLQAYGVGKLRPNILLMGYKENWASSDPEDLNQYFNVLHKTLDLHLSVCILRVSGGLDFSKKITFGDGSTSPLSHTSELSKTKSLSNVTLPKNNSNQSFYQIPNGSTSDLAFSMESTRKPTGEINSEIDLAYRSVDGGVLSADILNQLTQFQRKHKQGEIDVYWLYDDGGLTLLLPYIISTRSAWSSCKLRVFALANRTDEFDTEHRRMAGLLSKFRIDYSDLRVIPDIGRPPQEKTKVFFEKIVEQITANGNNQRISQAELSVMKEKTNRHLRLRELLLEYSKDSTLVVMTLPMPRKGIVSAELYMSWLETLTADLPPFLMVRGNQTSVLTFYS